MDTLWACHDLTLIEEGEIEADDRDRLMKKLLYDEHYCHFEYVISEEYHNL